MARNEHDDISHLDLPDEKTYKTYYIDASGKVTTEKEPANLCAKMIENQHGNCRYWV